MSVSTDFVSEIRDSGAPYHLLDRYQWELLRSTCPMPLSESEVESLRALNDPIDLCEVAKIYSPLSRLLRREFAAYQCFVTARQDFLQDREALIPPFVIAIAGSVAVGKSTTARLLQLLLQRWPDKPKVELVTTDGFLYPNAILQQMGKMRRKGFPDSYDMVKMLSFLADLKNSKSELKAPCYSHLTYDIIDKQYQTINRPDIVIFEGLNVLQVHKAFSKKLQKTSVKNKARVFVSDFFDFSIYIDADPKAIENWYLERFKHLRQTAFWDEKSYFRRYASLAEDEALSIAQDLWHNINLKNLEENIAPTKLRSQLILHKDANHLVDYIALRRC